MATILVACADHTFSEVLQNVLIAYRHEVVTARTGEEALQLVEGRQPAMALLDLALLGMPGLEVLAKIRAHTPHLPIVVLTSDVSVEVEDHVREMGVSDVLRKRLKLDVIMQAVNRALTHVGRPASAIRPAIASTPPATILIVDDEPVISEMVGDFLRQQGYRVTTAVSGEEALAMIQQELPDLILLDIYMPGMNGVEVLRKLNEAQSSVGVIMLTASQDEPLLKTALDLGAFDVLSKPVELNQVELAVMVKLMLSAKE